MSRNLSNLIQFVRGCRYLNQATLPRVEHPTAPTLFVVILCLTFPFCLETSLTKLSSFILLGVGSVIFCCLCKLARAGAPNLAEHLFQNAPTLLNYLRKNHHLGRFLKRGFSGCKQLLPKTPQGHQSIVLNLPAFRRMPWALSLESECECDWKPCVFL